MPTAVVSGRVDEELKRQADVIIRAAGTTVGNVINDVWHTIVTTGELPVSPAQAQERRAKQQTFDSFLQWFNALPPQNDAYARMTDDEILALRVDDYA